VLISARQHTHDTTDVMGAALSYGCHVRYAASYATSRIVRLCIYYFVKWKRGEKWKKVTHRAIDGINRLLNRLRSELPT